MEPLLSFSRRAKHLGSRLLPLAVGSFLFVGAVQTLGQEFQRHPPAQIWQSLQEISPATLAIALVFTALNYLILTGYDTLALRYVGHPLAYGQGGLVAAIAYAISNNIGFTFLSGGAIRYRFYHRWGVGPGAIAQIILFCSLSFWVGFLSVGGLLFTLEPQTVATLLRLPLEMVRPLGGVFLALMGGFVAWSLSSDRPLQLPYQAWRLPHLPFPLLCGQIGVSLADWTTVAALLYVLLPGGLLPGFGAFLGIYLLAKVAGVISNVPGGLGVFETVLLLSIAPPQAEVPAVLGVFLAYRGIYYLLPLAIALLAWATYEMSIKH